MKYREFCYKLNAKFRNLIVPELKPSQQIYGEVLQGVTKGNGIKWLDMGCGSRILPHWVTLSCDEKDLKDECEMVVGIDYDMNSLKKNISIHNLLRGDINKFPFRDSAFDIVTANMVVEHLEYPKATFQEVRRILNAGGRFLFHTPNIYGYSTILTRLIPDIIKSRIAHFLQNRKEEDIFETYYRVNTINEIIRISAESNMEIEKQILVTSMPQLSLIPFMLPFELLWIRLLFNKRFRHLRTGIITILKLK